jgi:hypothetical protein
MRATVEIIKRADNFINQILYKKKGSAVGPFFLYVKILFYNTFLYLSRSYKEIVPSEYQIQLKECASRRWHTGVILLSEKVL